MSAMVAREKRSPTRPAPAQLEPGPAPRSAPARIGGALRGAPAFIIRLVGQRPRGGALRVWIFVAVMTAAAVWLYESQIQALRPLLGAAILPWPILAVLFFIAEVKVVHFHFRRDAHSLSMNELPFVLGLFFVDPRWFLVALLAGSGTALAFHRRQSPIKLAFNLAQMALAAQLSLIVLNALRSSGAIVGVEDWAAPFLATTLNGVVGVVAIAVAISLSEGRPQFDKLPTMLKLSTLVTATNTSIALVAVMVLWRDPSAIWLLLVPVVTVFVAYKGYVAERQKHERLELLYESTRILQQTPELDAAIVGVLRHAAEMFRAEFAEIVLSGRSDAEPLRTTVGPDARVDQSVVVRDASPAAWPVLDRIDSGRILPVDPVSQPFARADGRVVRDAMIVALRGETRDVGTLMVANRMGDVSAFDAEDLRLFETMATHIAVALENGQLEQSLARLTALKEELRYQAYHDPLTALGNRTLLAERIEERLADRSRAGLRPVVLFLDLDDFKIVNDSLGHAAGDALLAEAGERIRGCLRTDDVAARLGGDEFAILLMDTHELRNAQLVARRIQQALRAPFALEAGEARVRVSVGIAAADARTGTADELLRYADVAMYTAKARGKSQIVVFEPSMHAAVVERHEMGEELQRAIGAREFSVYYQPIVDIRTREIEAFEALVRWRHPDRGLVHPSAFVSLAEEIGIIVPLGRLILHEACRQVLEWNLRRPDRPPTSVSVNLSARQLQQTTFVDDVLGVLEDTGFPPYLLILEVTETVMLHDTRLTVQALQALRAIGVRIAVDDFGTGYSSLSYLRRFPVDILKIAREFTDSGEEHEDAAFSDAILAIGRALGLTVIAEGIEREDQLDRLRDLGCELGQGYLFGRPGPARAFDDVLAELPQMAPRGAQALARGHAPAVRAVS